jgi:hypothetical protein
MTIHNRLARLEERIGLAGKPCPDHRVTSIVDAGDPLPDDADLLPCRNCGRPGIVLVIVEEIVGG